MKLDYRNQFSSLGGMPSQPKSHRLIRSVLAHLGPTIVQTAQEAQGALRAAAKDKTLPRSVRNELEALAAVYDRLLDLEEGVLYQRLAKLLMRPPFTRPYDW
jgi:hypothetical protein